MNPFTILQLMSTAATFIPQLKALASGGFGALTPGAVAGVLGEAEPLLAQLGAMFSPSAPDHVHSIIAATSLALEGHPAAGVQEALNLYLASVPGFVPLVVDGKMGPKTSAAILMAQTKAGLKADGWFGQLTAKAIGYVLQ